MVTISDFLSHPVAVHSIPNTQENRVEMNKSCLIMVAPMLARLLAAGNHEQTFQYHEAPITKQRKLHHLQEKNLAV